MLMRLTGTKIIKSLAINYHDSDDASEGGEKVTNPSVIVVERIKINN